MEVVRTGPLTWAQHMFWFYNDPYFMEDWGSEPRAVLPLRVPERTSIADLEDALAASAERHEALRTFYTRPGSGEPMQRVLAAYRPEVAIGPLAAVEAVSIFERPGFRCQAEVEGGVVGSAWMVANLIDLDGASMARVAGEVEAYLADGTLPASAGMQPIDLAASERGGNPGAEARAERGMRRARELRREAPRNFLPALHWRYGSGTTRSATLLDGAVMKAAESAADQCRITVPSLFHAGICEVVSEWTRTPRFVFSTAVANRWRRSVRDFVGRVASTVDCGFERAPDDTYRTVLKRTHSALANAYLHANRDFGAGVMEDARSDELTGSVLAKPVLIEYLDYLRDAGITLPDGRHTHATTEERRTDHLWFNIVPLPNTTSMNVNSDAAVLSETDAFAMLHQVVDFIQRAADGPDAPVHRPGSGGGAWGGIPGARMLESGGSRFSADRIEANIERCDGVAAAAVFMDAGAPVAYVAGAGSDLVAVHERLSVESSHDPLVKAPSLYVQTSEPPQSRHQESAWRALPAADRFAPADEYASRVVTDERFEVLTRAFVECHGPTEVCPTESYGALGGRYLAIAGVMELLREGGYAGVDPGDFLGPGSMSAIAGRMTLR